MFIVTVLCVGVRCTLYTVHACVCLFILFFLRTDLRFKFVYFFDGMCSSYRHFFNSIYGALFRLVSCLCGISENTNTHSQTHIQTHYGWMKVNWCRNQWPLILWAQFQCVEVVISHHITFPCNGHPISITRIIMSVSAKIRWPNFLGCARAPMHFLP